jgi:hypothetical protein
VSRAFRVGALAGPFNVAMGAEFRHENYVIGAGEPGSYRDGGVPNRFGGRAAIGAQVFPGFRASKEVDESRQYSRYLAIALLLLLDVARVFAADITGTWKASFDTQIGQQNYTYQFVVQGTTLTGKIQSEMGGTSEVLQGKVEGDKVSFVEKFKFDGNEIQITYTGQVTSDDEIKFTRQVAEFATEQIVAKRVK